MEELTRTGRRSTVVSAALALALALLVIPTTASAHPGHEYGQDDQNALGFRVNAPADLADFFPAVQWGATAEIDGETSDLVYAGTGCTPASYAPVIQEVQGRIAIVDSRVSATNPADQCPVYPFAQKAQSAEQSGAIGLIHIPGEGEEPNGNATAVHAGIPVLEVERTADILALRDAVIAGTAVNVTLTEPENFPAMSNLPCVDGMAGPFPCDGIDLLAFVPQEDFNGAGISDLWGWTDQETGDEYVIIGKTNGVAFFRVTDPTAPVYLGELPNPAVLQEVWHDIKVYADHAFIVSESEPHGMTVFDLTRLRDVSEPQTWDRDAWYQMNVAAHNLAINEATGYAYIVGGNEGIVAPDQCMSGLHMVDIRDPKNPTFAGCYLVDGGPGTGARTVGPPATDVSPAAYVHDAQCVVYEGPDEEHHGKEICVNFAEDQVTIADVTNKLAPVTLGVTDYEHVSYSHQGWLTEDQAFVIANDELDETDVEEVTNTRTIVLDVRDLDAPKVHFIHEHATTSIDHNNYVKGDLLYQSNYTSGLRVLDTSKVDHHERPRLRQLAFFDTYPASEEPTFDGTWSNYPYFDSGTIAVSGIGEGLFLLRLNDDASEDDGGGADRPKGPPAERGPAKNGPSTAGLTPTAPDIVAEPRAGAGTGVVTATPAGAQRPASSPTTGAAVLTGALLVLAAVPAVRRRRFER